MVCLRCCWLQYDVPRAELADCALWLSVWHSGHFGKHVFLGDVLIPLESYDIDQRQPRWFHLVQQGREVSYINYASLYTAFTCMICLTRHTMVCRLKLLLWVSWEKSIQNIFFNWQIFCKIWRSMFLLCVAFSYGLVARCFVQIPDGPISASEHVGHNTICKQCTFIMIHYIYLRHVSSCFLTANWRNCTIYISTRASSVVSISLSSR